MEFYVKFYLEMKLKLNIVQLSSLRQNFDYYDFQSFTDTVSQGMSPFVRVELNPTTKEWLINKLEGIWESKINQKEQ